MLCSWPLIFLHPLSSVLFTTTSLLFLPQVHSFILRLFLIFFSLLRFGLLPILYAFLILPFLVLLLPLRSRSQPQPFKRSPTYFRLTSLFPVSINNCIIDSTSMHLSTIRIPIQRAPPAIQHHFRNFRRTRVSHRYFLFRWFPLLAFLFFTPTTYAIIPGTSFAAATGETSLDSTRQSRYTASILQQIESLQPPVYFYINPSRNYFLY